MKKTCLLITGIAAVVFILCACEPLITRRDITKLPDKTVYVQYYDRELDFSGGKIAYHFETGSSVVYKMQGEITLRDNVCFNVPGTYKVYLDYPGDKTSFEIQVVPLEQADWLDENTIKGIKKWADIDSSQDQGAIKETINRYFEEMLKMRVEYSEEAVARGIKNIKSLLDSDSEFKDKLPAVLVMDYIYLFHYGYSAYTTYKAEFEYKYIYVKGNTAEACAYENVRINENSTEYSRHIFTMTKKDGIWYISNDETDDFITQDYYDEDKAAGLKPEQIVAKYQKYLRNLGK